MTDPKKNSITSAAAGKNSYPVLPMREMVVQQTITQVFVGRESSLKAIEAAMKDNVPLLTLTQKDHQEDNPGKDGLYKVGMLCNIEQFLKLPDGTVKLLLRGVSRLKVDQLDMDGEYVTAKGRPLLSKSLMSESELKHLAQSTSHKIHQLLRANIDETIDAEAVAAVATALLCEKKMLSVEQQQQILEQDDVAQRLTMISDAIDKQLEIAGQEKIVKKRVKENMEKDQREYYLRSQMKAIRQELGEDDEEGEIELLRDKINEKKGLPDYAREKAHSELKKLSAMSPMAAEASVIRNYIDWVIALPWNNNAELNYDDAAIEKKLNDDHYGLEKPKELILEHMAVLERSAKAKGKVILLVGPPGVGKTSLGRSVAEATGRELVRISLGGVRDEAELRGHRRTYIGSMPGKILQALRKCATGNPLFLLDEIEKMGQDHRGDPSSALLEILDPEQNSAFVDHYLELEYDLSNVLFFCTANSLNMQGPLLDRFEVVQLSGYTREQKFEIAKRHLVGKKMDRAALSSEEFQITDGALYELVDKYTREAGVRELERQIEKLCRKAARAFKQDPSLKSFTVTEDNLKEFAGTPRYGKDEISTKPVVGEVKGLAWNGVGGATLDIEAVKWPDKTMNIQLTGKLGDVMKESVSVAKGLLMSRAAQGSFGLDIEDVKNYHYHVHVPDGATPKDGPSAGAAMVTALFSVASGKPVRSDVAMTGEVRLNGKILPIGGLTEKLQAALLAGITTVIVPKANELDLEDVPQEIRAKFKDIVKAETIEDVLKVALVDGENVVRDFAKTPMPIPANQGRPVGQAPSAN